MIQDNLFNYKRFVFLKWALLLTLISSFAYLFDQPRINANGGTWLGYTLGTIGALLILWLMWFGVRKRQYANESGNLRGWVSAHIYLGLALSVVATLHTGFQIGWNVHSLAYVLTMATIGTGVWGLSFYLRYPAEMSNVLNRQSPEQIVAQIQTLDKDAQKLAKNESSMVTRVITNSQKQGIYPNRGSQRKGAVKNCATEKAVEYLQHEMMRVDSLSEIYKNQVQRLRALKQLRRYYHLRYWLELWLSVHVPLSFGLLAALIAHVLSVFIYW
ncbi:MAG: hypothetical protein LW710_08755 [Burkholderiales bacterium]|jgi:hypothetical protein|uniref:hypothetical protein n=1 Tax=Limnobacter sp. TaxID=2003368 RepID=UPI00391FEAF0|nr:hypothetical protein [Burkholderiales bacterium]